MVKTRVRTPWAEQGAATEAAQAEKRRVQFVPPSPRAGGSPASSLQRLANTRQKRDPRLRGDDGFGGRVFILGIIVAPMSPPEYGTLNRAPRILPPERKGKGTRRCARASLAEFAVPASPPLRHHRFSRSDCAPVTRRHARKGTAGSLFIGMAKFRPSGKTQSGKTWRILSLRRR